MTEETNTEKPRGLVRRIASDFLYIGTVVLGIAGGLFSGYFNGKADGVEKGYTEAEEFYEPIVEEQSKLIETLRKSYIKMQGITLKQLETDQTALDNILSKRNEEGLKRAEAEYEKLKALNREINQRAFNIIKLEQKYIDILAEKEAEKEREKQEQRDK